MFKKMKIQRKNVRSKNIFIYYDFDEIYNRRLYMCALTVSYCVMTVTVLIFLKRLKQINFVVRLYVLK